MMYAGDFPASHTAVCIPFDSFAAATGAPSAVTNFANTDVLIYKDGGTTQRTSANGITVTTSFDTQTGLQMIVIDTSDNTDAGFYAAGHEYQVAVADITVDGQTLRFWAGTFSIERAGGMLALLKDATFGLSALETLVDDLESRIGTPSNLGSGATVAANLVDIEGQTDDIGVAGAGLTALGDARLGNLDATVSSRATQASVDAVDNFVDTEIADIQARLPAALINGKMSSTDALASGTADSGTTTTLVDAARTEADTDYWARQWLRITSGNLAGQMRLITAFTPGTDTITVAPAFTQAVGTHDYEILPAASMDVHQWRQANVPSPSAAGRPLVDVTHWLNNAASATTINGVPRVDMIATDGSLNPVTNIAAGVWNRLTSALTTAGSIGKLLVDMIDATISSRLAGASYTTPPTANENADALLDRADAIEIGWTVRKAWRIALAALAGKSSGHDTNAPVYRDVTDTKARITATTSTDGRSAVTTDAT